MNAPRTPIALDSRTVESHAPPMCLFTSLKPGAFFDAFKSAAARPAWARCQDMRVPVDAPEGVRPAAEVRAAELRWSDWEGTYARSRARDIVEDLGDGQVRGPFVKREVRAPASRRTTSTPSARASRRA